MIQLKKILAVLFLTAVLMFSVSSVSADPGGGTTPFEPETVVVPMSDPGGGTTPEGH